MNLPLAKFCCSPSPEIDPRQPLWNITGHTTISGGWYQLSEKLFLACLGFYNQRITSQPWSMKLLTSQNFGSTVQSTESTTSRKSSYGPTVGSQNADKGQRWGGTTSKGDYESCCLMGEQITNGRQSLRCVWPRPQVQRYDHVRWLVYLLLIVIFSGNCFLISSASIPVILQGS